jgi:UDP-glucose 4-epimerase
VAHFSTVGVAQFCIVGNKNEGTLNKNCDLLVGDVRDISLIRQCMTGMDGCFHLSAVAPAKKFMGNSISMHQINLNGSINILNAACGENTPAVYASSSAVYGDNAEPLLRE